MNFDRFLNAVLRGTLEQIPGAGPILVEILREMQRSESQTQSADLGEDRRANQQNVIRKFVKECPLAFVEFILASARQYAARTGPLPKELAAEKRQDTTPQTKRFIYLASTNYAAAERTCDFVFEHRFLWRSYYANVRNSESLQRISNVNNVEANDIIVLGYRYDGGFRILLPLVVQPPQSNPENTHPIPAPNPKSSKTTVTNFRDHSPFVWANKKLAQALARERYEPDPRLNEHTGLNVLPLPVNLQDEETKRVFAKSYLNPGSGALWYHDHPRIAIELTRWVQSL